MARLPGVRTDVKDGGLGMVADAADGQRAITGVSSKGPVGVPVSFSDPTQVVVKLGIGPLSSALVWQLAKAGGSVVAMRCPASIAGAIVPDPNNPAQVVEASGATLELLDLVVVITDDGPVGESAFTFSLDGGDNVSIPIATSAVFEIPGTGVTLSFTSVDPYVLGSAYRFAVSAPEASVGDVQTAVRTLLDANMLFEYIHVAQPTDNGMWAALAALREEAITKGRRIFMIAETEAPGGDPDVWLQNLLVQKELFEANGVLLSAAFMEVVDPITGRLVVQNMAHELGARLSRSPVSENPGWVQNGPIQGGIVAAPFRETEFGKQPLYNNSHALALDTAGFTAIHQIPNRGGYFFVDGRMAAPRTSDYASVTNERVMNKAVTLIEAALTDHIQEAVDPVDLEVSLAALVADAEAPIRFMRALGEISGGRVVIPPGQDVLSTRTLMVQVRIVPLGYLRDIILDIGLENPYLYREEVAR